MRKKLLIRGPALTRSGYGEHTRFLLRSLRPYEEEYDLYLITTNWGQTGWLATDDDERKWMDMLMIKTNEHQNKKLPYDVSIQVTIPNEWDRLAPVNIGVTAGIETTKVAPVWLEKANMMDKIITISEHSKNVYLNSIYHGTHPETNQPLTLKCEKPIDIVHYPVKKYEKANLDLEMDTEFNFLTVSQWGPRKNLEKTIKWFVEEFVDQKVGLVVKTFMKNNSTADREHVTKMIHKILKGYPQKKCKIYLLHGEMSDEEMHSLYTNPKIKALISLTHGEGFGLPLFEAAYSGLPVIAPGWSGHLDFLHVPMRSKKNNITKNKSFFAKVDYTLEPVKKDAVWEGVLERDSLWCYAKQGSYKMKLREVYKDHGRFKSQARKLKKYIHENFSHEGQHEKFAQSIKSVMPENQMFDIERMVQALN